MRYRWVVIAICFPLLLCAQTGTRFWFAVPYLTPQHDNSLAAEYSKLCFTSYDRPATITVSQPGMTDVTDWHYFAPYTITLAANSTVDVPLSTIGINRAEHKKKVPYGILIESDEDISVYFAQTNANSEIYTLKGENALGTDFIVGMQNAYPTSWSGFASIEILATEDNTVVDITTPVPSANNPTGAPVQVTLNRGEVYTVVAKSAGAADHLSGTVIHASQPVAVNSTDDSVAASGQDLVGDQLVPDRLAGTEYIAVKHTGQAENLYIYALQDNTSFTVNGATQPVLNTGQTRVLGLTDAVSYIQSGQPLVIFQLTGDGGELGGTQLPKLACTGSSAVVYKARFAAQPKVVVLVHSDYTGYFRVNGSSSALTAADFSVVPGTTDWSYCVKPLTPQASTGLLNIRNDSAVFHLGVLDSGGGGTCTYGYFSDYNTEHLTATNGKPFYIEGETLSLSLKDADRYSDIVWTFADGTEVTGPEVDLPAMLSYMGYVSVTAKSKNGCDLIQDTRQLALHILTPDERDSVICEGSEETLTRAVDKFGFNMLGLHDDTVTCSAPPQQLWKAVTELEEGQLYALTLDLSVANTNRKANLQITANGEAIGTVASVSLSATATPYTFRWTATNKGRTEITIRTTVGTVSGAVIRIAGVVLQPVFPVTETVHVLLTANPPVVPVLSALADSVAEGETTSVRVSNGQNGISYYWYKEGVPVAEDVNWIEAVEGEYTVKAVNEDGCEEWSQPLHIYTKENPEPPEPPEPVYSVVVELLTEEVTLCDGDERFDIAYMVTEGEAHVLTLGGTTIPLNGMGTEEMTYLGGPCDTVWELTFTDTVHHVSAQPLKLALHVYFSPLGIFTQKWGNTLAAYNGDYSGYHLILRDFQWWQDGQALLGENKSYLYLQEGFPAGAEYVLTAVFTGQDGKTKTMRTCPYVPIEGQQPAPRRIYTVSGMNVNNISCPGVYLVIEGENKKLVIQP